MPSGDVLVLVDESGRVVEWGRPAEELFGWSAEEAVGQPVSTLMREAATDGEGRRGKFTDAAAVLVKPVLRGTSVVWQVLSAGDTMSGQDVAILKAVFTHSPVGLHVLDDQLRVVRMSTTTGGPRDAEVERLVGKQFTEAYELANPEEESAVAQRVLDSGVPVVNRLVRRITSPGLPRAPYSLRLLLPPGGPQRRCGRTGGVRRRRHRAGEGTEPTGLLGHGSRPGGPPAERDGRLPGAGGDRGARLQPASPTSR